MDSSEGMERDAEQVVSSKRAAKRGPHLLLYDGECGLCNGLVQAILKRDRNGIFHFAPLQSRLAANVLERFPRRADDLDTVVVIPGYEEQRSLPLIKARAALFVLSALGWPWKAAAVLNVVPSGLLDSAYDFVARNRHRFFRKSEVCLLPLPEHRHRFVRSEDNIESGKHLER